MAVTGSVSDGDNDKILEVEEEDCFPPNFKEYMLKELSWTRFKEDGCGNSLFGWVFWSQQDHETNSLGKEYKYFYADAESGEEELGLPGRVFLHKFPESTSDVKHYTLKEYPQLDLALRCSIRGSWAMPVFEHSSKTCVGVLEIVSLSYTPSFWHDKSFLGNLYGIFQFFSIDIVLAIFSEVSDVTILPKQHMDENKALAAAFKELKMVLGSSSFTGNEAYVLEFFLPTSSKDDENILARLSMILGTMEESFKTFKLASGQDLGDVLTVKVIDFLNGQKSHSIQMIQATRLTPCLELLKDGGVILQIGQLDQPTMDAKNSGMDVVSEDHNYFLPSLEASQNGELKTELDSTDQTSMDPLNNGKNVTSAERNIILVASSEEGKRIQATRFTPSPSLELLKDEEVILQIGQLGQPTLDARNSGMNVVSEEQNYILPGPEALQNGEWTTQLDSTDQPSMDTLNNGTNVSSFDHKSMSRVRSHLYGRKIDKREKSRPETSERLVQRYATTNLLVFSSSLHGLISVEQKPTKALMVRNSRMEDYGS
ncbi:hypothetical protein RHSIM_Rhsim12G0172300 [Rhododendron simsii]|uniref:NLP1-9 GAF domain-containing protein n=1 Tax=Rhododendron simsii TaxID=118357 RepID=A0A834L7X6_RHOSS|nr:hypothetical protein RHSIM_Rhsim12G0172300 [Rhododendron simsii]